MRVFPAGGALRDQLDNARCAISDNERRPFPRLSEEEKERVCREVARFLQAEIVRRGLTTPCSVLIGLDFIRGGSPGRKRIRR